MLPLGPYSWSCCLHHQGQYWETSSITSSLWPTLSIDILPAGCLVVLGIHRSDQKMNKTGYSQIKRLIKLVKWKYTKVQIYRENQKLLRVDTSRWGLYMSSLSFQFLYWLMEVPYAQGWHVPHWPPHEIRLWCWLRFLSRQVKIILVSLLNVVVF